MKRDSGSPDFPIWLIGDSSPENWERHLDVPLDARHPARHNIWTPILEGIQSYLFSTKRTRLCSEALYIRNAVHRASDKPDHRTVEWLPNLQEETRDLACLVNRHAPALVLTFGAFAFEFVRRSLDEAPPQAYWHWTTTRLGQEFRQRTGKFRSECTNLFPLLHVSIARGRFLESHRNFTGKSHGNYFDQVAQEIARCLCNNESVFSIGAPCAGGGFRLSQSRRRRMRRPTPSYGGQRDRCLPQ